MDWEVDTGIPVPSYCLGTYGDGSLVPQPWGPFPSALDPSAGTGMTLADEIWSEYITYEILTVTPTPTSEPTATPIPLEVPATNPSGLILVILSVSIVLVWNARRAALINDPQEDRIKSE